MRSEDHYSDSIEVGLRSLAHLTDHQSRNFEPNLSLDLGQYPHLRCDSRAEIRQQCCWFGTPAQQHFDFQTGKYFGYLVIGTIG